MTIQIQMVTDEWIMLYAMLNNTLTFIPISICLGVNTENIYIWRPKNDFQSWYESNSYSYLILCVRNLGHYDAEHTFSFILLCYTTLSYASL